MRDPEVDSRRENSRDYSRGEVVQAHVWLAIFAGIAAMLQVDYLWPPLAAVTALLFNAVLTKTARLWSSRRATHLIPLSVWLASCWGMGWVTGAQISKLLLIAGIAGSVWPLARGK